MPLKIKIIVMKIEQNKVVSVTYDLRTDGHDSDIVESATVEMPLEFIYGNGMMLPKFEEYLSDKNKGDDFQFMLNSDEAYGPIQEENYVELPKSAFQVDGKIDDEMLQIGNVIPLQDQDGNRFDGLVAEILDDTVKMDFNHPMAGEDLYFTGKIIEVRDATAEELEHGHVHGHGHHH